MSSDKNNTTILQKIKKIFQKNPAASISASLVALKVVGIFALCIIIIALMYSVIAAFATFFGFNEKKFTSGEYNNMTLTELQEHDYESCYKGNYENWFDATWQEITDWFGTGLNSECELVELVRQTTEKYEKRYDGFNLELSPGLVVSSLIYSYSSQIRGSEGDIVDPGQPMKVLKAIADNNIYTAKDIDEMVNNMIFYETFWYYNCESLTCTKNGSIVDEDTEPDEIKVGRKCIRNLYFDVRFSREKYQVYLRFGSQAAAAYEAAHNHNKSKTYTCGTCYYEWYRDNDYYKEELDEEKYLSVADYKNSQKDDVTITISDLEASIFNQEINDINKYVKRVVSFNLTSGTTFTYRDGHIYKIFPNFQTAFENGTNYENEIYTPKNIEKSIDSINSYEDSLNKVIGKDDINEFGNPNQYYKTEEKDGRCPSGLTCDCENGNVTPGGNPIGASYFGKVCEYLNNKNTKIRLYTCHEPEYAYRNPSSALPGGAYATRVKGRSVYMAKNAITLEQYLKGVAVTEGYSSKSVEGTKLQMLLAVTYLFHHIEEYGYEKNASGEFEIKAGSCFQNYKEFDYKNNYLYSRYKQNVDTAYEEIKDKILINSSTGAINSAPYSGSVTKSIYSMANQGMSYSEILASDYMRTVKGGAYANAEIRSCGYSDLPYVENDIAKIALSYVGKDVGDCSQFARRVLKEAGYNSDFSSKACEGKSRRSYGMYQSYTNAGKIVWRRTNGSSLSLAMSTFPGGCAPGDLIFYSQGNDECVRHVAIYIGQENGNHMITDSTIANNVVKYRKVTAPGNNWIPLACARAY